MALETDLEKIVYFGDSLTDRGLFFDLSGQVLKVPLPPASAGYAGKFSNGEVHSGYTPLLLGVEAEVYAIGAARAVGSRTVAEYIASFGQPDILLPDPDPAALQTDTFLTAQVDRYVAATGTGGAAPGTAAALFIGANDYNALFDPSQPPPSEAAILKLLGEVLGSTQSATQRVLQTGVEQVLLYNLPDATFFPPPPGLDPALIEAGNRVVEAHNAGLAGVAQAFRTAGADVQIVDINRITDEITADPRTFGFRPEFVDEPALLGLGSRPIWLEAQDAWFMPPNPDVAGVDPDQLLFFDFLHPTTATHGVLGAFAAASLTARQTFRDAENDLVRLGDEDDLMLAGAGNDLVHAAGGDDTVLAGHGRDVVHANGGDDIVSGGSGHDLLIGGGGRDVIAPGAGGDVGSGGRGRDLMIEEPGSDLLIGGSGGDAFLFTEAALRGGETGADSDRFAGGSGIDTCYLVLTEATEALARAELRPGRAGQELDSIGLSTLGIEEFVFLGPGDDLGQIATPARFAEADLWGLA